MFIEVTESMVGNIPVQSWGVVLEVDGEAVAVPVSQLEEIYFNAEELNEATELTVVYDGEEFSMELPEKDSRDWQILEEIANPE